VKKFTLFTIAISHARSVKRPFNHASVHQTAISRVDIPSIIRHNRAPAAAFPNVWCTAIKYKSDLVHHREWPTALKVKL
jgi:hypothetical protein